MTAKTAIVHIGYPKTGSTTLQHGLRANTGGLKEQGFFYPVGYLPDLAQHSDLATYLRKRDTQKFETSLGGMLEAFATSGCDHFILSGEGFSYLSDRQVGVLFATLRPVFQKIRVLLYVRNLYRYALSLLAQDSKTNLWSDGIIDLNTTLRRAQTFDPTATIRRWEQCAGEDNMDVLCLEKLPGDVGILEHFSACFGISLPAPERNRLDNASMDPIMSAFLSRLVYEFQYPHVDLSWAYFRERSTKFSLPRLETYLLDCADGWVAGVDLTHPKLAPYAATLREKPTVPPSEGVPLIRSAEYLEFLAKVFLRAAKKARVRAERHAARQTKLEPQQQG